MAITLSSILNFPFRGGRGIDQDQIWWEGAMPPIDGTVYEDTATSITLDTDAKLNKLYILEPASDATVNITHTPTSWRILTFFVPGGSGITVTIQQSGTEVATVEDGQSVTLVYEPSELTEWLIVQDAGVAGEEGPTGPRGLQGERGPTGPQGQQGRAGADGAQGPQGNPGTPGTPGAPGAAGADGRDGAQGPQGDRGATGDAGPQGPAGSDGARGPTGDRGPAGPGVPPGGTAGQILEKVDGTNYNTQWADAEAEAPEGSLVWPGLAEPGHIIWPNVGS